MEVFIIRVVLQYMVSASLNFYLLVYRSPHVLYMYVGLLCCAFPLRHWFSLLDPNLCSSTHARMHTHTHTHIHTHTIHTVEVWIEQA